MCWWLLLLLLWCCCNQTASKAVLVLVLVLDNLSALTRSPLRWPGSADLTSAGLPCCCCWWLLGLLFLLLLLRLLFLLLYCSCICCCCCSGGGDAGARICWCCCCCSCRAMNQPPRQETNSQTFLSKPTRNSKTPPNFVPAITSSPEAGTSLLKSY